MNKRERRAKRDREHLLHYYLAGKPQNRCLFTNLDEISEHVDAVQEWAAAAEFALRSRRYDLWRRGGVRGAMLRLTDVIVGDPDYAA